MYDSDCEMLDLEQPSTSNVSKLSLSPNTDDDVEVDGEQQQEDSTLWSIDDDSLFFARGLMNHSAGRGKSVFVTWNDNYLINFVFKTSSNSKKTSLTKVRLSMPLNDEGEPEEIKDLLIMELNTLLLTKSGRVYYFSSVKSIHPIAWLKGVYCVTGCPQTQFSVIRFSDNCHTEGTSKQLLLEVYQDVAQLGKCGSRAEILRRSYDISFDLQNLFNCNWHDERYTLLSMITDEENIDFLRKLLSIGNIIRADEERSEIGLNQELHIFTVSGNMFMLVGAIISEMQGAANVENYYIQLLNTYASNIECIQIDCEKNLLMVLLESGHVDIWYKSHKTFGSIQHLSHELSYYTHYDYNPCDNTFYITTPEEVTQMRVIYDKENCLQECRIRVVHKAIGGIIACTWVKNLQQLVCLSYNNIFYRLCFDNKSNGEDKFKEIDVQYENLQTLYALTNKKIKDLVRKAQIVNELMELPMQLHDAIENEFQKQQLLALGYKQKLWKKVLECRIEYHVNVPANSYFGNDFVVIKASFDRPIAEQEETSIYVIIYLNLTKKDRTFISTLKVSAWYLEISNKDGGSLLLLLPTDLLDRNLCFVIKCTTTGNKRLLPDFTISFRTFINHCAQYICINIDVDVLQNEKTYLHVFSYGLQQLMLVNNHQLYPDNLIQNFKQRELNNPKHSTFTKWHVKQILKLAKEDILRIWSILNITYESNINSSDMKLYFLQRYLLCLRYDDNQQLLTITTENVETLMYFKIFLMYELRSHKHIDNIALTNSKSAQLSIMRLQCDIERIYGSLLSSPDCMDVDSGTISLHLENLHKVYSKLRCEFNEIFR